MLDLNFIRENPDIIKANSKRRGCKIDIDELLKIDEENRSLQKQIDNMRAERKKTSKTGKPDEAGVKSLREKSDTLKGLEEKQRKKNEKLLEMLALLPNLLDPEVPRGKDDSDNKEIRKWGELPSFNFKPKDHLEIGEKLDIIDVQHAARVSGARFYYLKNEGVLLRLALIQYGLNALTKEGFIPFFTPHLAKTKTLYGTGYLPFFSDDIWKVGDNGLCLIGTSEQTLVGYHQDEILNSKSLPLRYAGLSSSFRTEAGSYGRDTRGIFRVHEFYKLEQIIFCLPNESEKWQNYALSLEEKFCQDLELPYRVVLVCDGDCGAPGYKKYDMESWFPSQEKYRELTSNTNLTDFQTRRLNIRAKIDGKTIYPHTISATGLTDRFLIAILENHQNEDGSVNIPETLQPFMNRVKIITKK